MYNQTCLVGRTSDVENTLERVDTRRKISSEAILAFDDFAKRVPLLKSSQHSREHGREGLRYLNIGVRAKSNAAAHFSSKVIDAQLPLFEILADAAQRRIDRGHLFLAQNEFLCVLQLGRCAVGTFRRRYRRQRLTCFK